MKHLENYHTISFSSCTDYTHRLEIFQSGLKQSALIIKLFWEPIDYPVLLIKALSGKKRKNKKQPPRSRPKTWTSSQDGPRLKKITLRSKKPLSSPSPSKA